MLRFSIVWRLGSVWLALGLGCSSPAPAAAEPSEGKILTDAELAALGRESAMWRLVRPDEEVPANLARLAKAGFSAQEVAGLQVRLAGWWDVPVERNFGWLHEDTIAQIKEIDQRFVVRMRAARLFAGTGILKGAEKPVSAATLTGLWRSAILKVLDFDELAEFRLMNSASARHLTQLVKDLPVSDDELRTLFQWQREYEGTHQPAAAGATGQPAWQLADQLDQWRRIRDLLGDARFAIYLGRASPAFARMHLVLDKTGPVNLTAALDLWWLRQKYAQARSNHDPVVRRENELKAEFRTKALGLLGDQRLAHYLEDEDGRWLADRPVAYRSSAQLPVKSP